MVLIAGAIIDGRYVVQSFLGSGSYGEVYEVLDSHQGGVFALKLGGMPLSVSAVVGFIALLGQVSLLGLLQVSAIEQHRAAGAPLETAISAGAVEKLRAVLMAALLALFGLLPMALSQGIGSETQRPFALVIVGGMVTTLAITLFVLPGVYYMLASEHYTTPEAEDETA